MINLNGIKTIYINGIKASTKDIESLRKWIKAKRIQAYATITKKGNIAIRTI